MLLHREQIIDLMDQRQPIEVAYYLLLYAKICVFNYFNFFCAIFMEARIFFGGHMDSVVNV